ncbi:response regulator [Leeuwenhoekiella sp. A16]|uniref:response regulator n=1 Tax=unclassified Leeuwenhoekiella TaxID=2615029 RepID=UPI003A7FFF85|tara:strand:- start:29992 stop:30393 length:402 start_codon:yes stop_codon:yes gene_type:complete
MKKVKLACIIDDDPIFVFGIKKMMELTEFCDNFLICCNGKEALDKLTSIIAEGENIPEVILLDLNMPVMDGWEFLEEFTKVDSPKQIVIYIVTSSIDTVDLERAKEFNIVSNYVVKPIAVKDLEGIKEKISAL